VLVAIVDVAGRLGLFTVALACISSIALNDQVFNFARYLSVPALLLVAAAIWLWPRRATGWARWPASSFWSAWRCPPWATPWRPLSSGALGGSIAGDHAALRRRRAGRHATSPRSAGSDQTTTSGQSARRRRSVV
jgi:hypothetical protein